MSEWSNIDPTQLRVDRAIAAPIDPLEHGWFDWATGLIVLNTNHGTFRAAFDSDWRDPAAASTVATWNHEMTHRQQVVASGFLFWWASGWFDLMQAVGSQAVRTFDRPTAHSMMEVGRNPSAYISSQELLILQDHIRPLLAVQSKIGICALDILESHALVAEGFSADPEYLIRSAPSLRYSKALKLAANMLGTDLVLDAFPVVSAASFMTVDPVISFDRLLSALSSNQRLCRQIIAAPILAIRILEDILAPTASSRGWWSGTSEDQLEIARSEFPILRWARKFSADIKADNLKYADLMNPPYKSAAMLKTLAWPVFLTTGSADLDDMVVLNTASVRGRELLDLLYFADMSRRVYEFASGHITSFD